MIAFRGEAARTVASRLMDEDGRWTDVLPLTEGQGAFERLATDPGDRIKIALRP